MAYNYDWNQKNRFTFSALKELWRNTLRLGGVVWRERRGLFLGFLAAVVATSIFSFAQSGANALLINELVRIAGGNRVTTNLVLFLALMVAVGIVGTFLATLSRYFDKAMSFFTEERFQLMVLEAQAKADIAAHESTETKNLISKVMETGTWRMENFTSRGFFIVQNVTEVVIASSIIAFSSWWVFLVVLAGTIPALLNEVFYGYEVWGIFHSKAEIKRRFSDLRNHFYQLSDIVELKLFQNVKHFIGELGKLFAAFQNEQRTVERKKLAKDFSLTALSQIVIAFALVWFVLQVVGGTMEIGTLTFMIAAITGLRGALSSFFSNLGYQYQDNLFVTDVFALANMEPVIKVPADAAKLDPKTTPAIAFEDVTFAYPGTKEPVLRDFSLAIAPGEKLALIGVNGAGKTTLVKLLCRFYDPQKGRITLGGRDIRTIDLESWYAMLAVLFQEFSNYHFPVKEAIGVGRTSEPLAMERVKKSAEASEAHTFIEKWKEKYDQQLSREFTAGEQPSGGQWQKLALARTFYRDARVLVLDEPTSSIDAEAEAKIFEKLEDLPKERTVILISHRFSTVRRADTIAVIENGTVKESGTHEALLKKKGTYARLFALQAKGYR